MKTIDRWRDNTPLTDAEFNEARDNAMGWLFRLFFSGIVLLALLCVIGCRVVHGNEPGAFQRKHVVYVFSQSQGCLFCEFLHDDIQGGYFNEWAFQFCMWDDTTKRWNRMDMQKEFIKVFPQARTKSWNPQIPFVWVPGAKSYHVGYNRTSQQREQLTRYLRINTGKPVAPTPANVPPGFDGPGSPMTPEMLQAREPQTFDSSQEDLTGVVIVVCVRKLAEKYETFRSMASTAIRDALQSLVAEKFGAAVSVYLLTEVEQEGKYTRVTAATLREPSPVAVHLLIPKRLEGVKSFLADRLGSVLKLHYAETLQNAPINIVTERFHDVLYHQVVTALQDTSRSPEPDNPERPTGFIGMMAAAYFGERSKLGRLIVEKLMSRFGKAEA